MGLEHNNQCKDNKLIHSYDEFVWRPYMDSAAKGTNLEGKYQAGDFFLDEFERRTYPWRHCIKACAGRSCEGGVAWWRNRVSSDRCHEVLGRGDGVVQKFFPAIMPGISIIMHQDFAHWYTSWIHPIHYRFREYFEPLYDVPSSGSMVFRLIQPLPSDLLKQEWSPVQFSRRGNRFRIRYSLEIVSSEKRPNIVAAKIMYFVHAGQIDRAKQEIVNARSSGYSFDSDLSIGGKTSRRAGGESCGSGEANVVVIHMVLE